MIRTKKWSLVEYFWLNLRPYLNFISLFIQVFSTKTRIWFLASIVYLVIWSLVEVGVEIAEDNLRCFNTYCHEKPISWWDYIHCCYPELWNYRVWIESRQSQPVLLLKEALTSVSDSSTFGKELASRNSWVWFFIWNTAAIYFIDVYLAPVYMYVLGNEDTDDRFNFSKL